MKTVYFLILVVTLFLVVDVDAGWKFWKKKKDEPTSTENPLSTSTATSTTAVPAKSTTQGPKGPTNANRGIAAAADPALAIGVGNVGGKIREDSKNQPRKPNPYTDVGLDIGPPKPTVGTSYRDWAADLTGVGGGSIREKPKVPNQGPALSPGDQHSNQGNRPTSFPGTSSEQKPAVIPATRPESVHGIPSGQHIPNSGPAVGKVTAPHSPEPTPVTRPSTPAPQLKPNQGIPQSKPGSTTGTRSWADVAGGGSRQGPSTPAPKSILPTPSRPAQHPYEHQQPGSAGQSGRPGISTGAVIGGIGGAAGGVALAGATAAGASTVNSGKIFSSNPTYSKGNIVTDEDLEKLSEALFIKDVNNANKYITLNLQKTTSGNNPKDEASQPLLQVKPEALQLPTIQKVLTIYDNYKLDTREGEYISPAQRQEESLLVDTFLSTNLMSAAMRFLADKGFIKKDYYEYKDTLRSLWFNLYSRGEGKIGSSGFEHVFLTELKLGTEVSGLHNWIYFNAEELKKRLDYLGYIKKVDLGNKAAIVKVHVRFNGIDKPVTNIFVGTSPELEMALYTVCFFARPDSPCSVSLGGTKFNILTHKFRYRGRDLIGSAYPDI